MTYLKLVTPTNIAAEQAKFLKDRTYAPQFSYNWDAATIAAYRRKKPELIPLIDALLNQDGSAITRTAQTYFNIAYRAADIKLAEQLIKTRPAEANGTAQEVAALMVEKLRDLGIDYQTEIVDRHGFQSRPDHRAKIIRISKYLHLQFYPVEGIVNHELVHIIRAVNGQANNIAPAPDYLPTEEGLACLVQDGLLQTPSASSFQHALEYLASYIAKDAGFREVYDFFLAHGCNPKNAWLRSIRQKFGLQDTSKPGSLMKSGMYFYHEQLLRALTMTELTRLFVGKIPLADLGRYEKYSGAVAVDKIEELLGQTARIV